MLAAIGLGVGLIAAIFAVRLLSSVLFGVTVWDPVAWIAAAAALALAALIASWLPARRAVRVDPVQALRG